LIYKGYSAKFKNPNFIQKHTMERQLLWNCMPDYIEEAGRWYFFIVNEQREIRRIQARILNRLQPTRNITERKGDIQDLKYKLLILHSPVPEGETSFDNIYKGVKVRQERRLDEDREDGIDGLVASITDSLIKGTL